MPGPKMGPRPADFNEALVRQSPTFIKWSHLKDGDSLRYACRDFVKGLGDDEERLMRRIMIARRNNLRDHETLKKARKITKDGVEDDDKPTKKRRIATGMTDGQVAKEMDLQAVEATRSYRAWAELEDGKDFVYNQRYTKGKDGHDWLLKKNIWRRMRYRRENKIMVDRMKQTKRTRNPNSSGAVNQGTAINIIKQEGVDISQPASADATIAPVIPAMGIGAGAVGVDTAAVGVGEEQHNHDISAAAGIVDHALLASAAAAAGTVEGTTSHNGEDPDGHNDFVNKAVVEAAVAAAESYVKSEASAAAAAAVAAAAAADTDLSSIAALTVPEAEKTDPTGIPTPVVPTAVHVHNPLEVAANSTELLDAAAKLAAATGPSLADVAAKAEEELIKHDHLTKAVVDDALIDDMPIQNLHTV